MYHFDLIRSSTPHSFSASSFGLTPASKMITNNGCSLKAAQMSSIDRAAKLPELFALTEDLATALLLLLEGSQVK